MHMPLSSQILSTLKDGVVLNIDSDEIGFTAYILISEPDLNIVAQLMPQEEYEQFGNVHVAAVNSPDDALDEVSELTFNLAAGDAAIFLCANEAAFQRTLREFGQPNYPTQIN